MIKMTINKRRKNSRQRGSSTHGCGSKKKRRGSGNRGGFGMAGTGKRADQRKPSVWQESYFGKKGFISKSRNKGKIHPINILDVSERLNGWMKNGLVSMEHGAYSIDLEKLGYNKLLSKGRVSLKLKIKTPYASGNAVQKVKEAGGEVSGMLKIESKAEEA